MPSQITDALRAEVTPRAKRSRAGAPAAIPDRTFLEALLYLADSEGEWRQLPEGFGAGDAVYNRPRRRSTVSIAGRLGQNVTSFIFFHFYP